VGGEKIAGGLLDPSRAEMAKNLRGLKGEGKRRVRGGVFIRGRKKRRRRVKERDLLGKQKIQ